MGITVLFFFYYYYYEANTTQFISDRIFLVDSVIRCPSAPCVSGY